MGQVGTSVGEMDFAAGFAAGAEALQNSQVAAQFASDPAVAEFVQRWGLGVGSVGLLENLPGDAKARILAEFDPRDNTRNVDAKLKAFAGTVVSGQGRQVQTFNAVAPPNDPFAAFVDGPGFQGMPSPCMAPHVAPQMSFGDWNCPNCGDVQFAR